MPVSLASLVQNLGDFPAHLTPLGPAPVTDSQPEARTVTAGRDRPPAAKMS